MNSRIEVSKEGPVIKYTIYCGNHIQFDIPNNVQSVKIIGNTFGNFVLSVSGNPIHMVIELDELSILKDIEMLPQSLKTLTVICNNHNHLNMIGFTLPDRLRIFKVVSKYVVTLPSVIESEVVEVVAKHISGINICRTTRKLAIDCESCSIHSLSQELAEFRLSSESLLYDICDSISPGTNVLVYPYNYQVKIMKYRTIKRLDALLTSSTKN